MKAKDWFGLIVRVLGLLLAFVGLGYLVSGLATQLIPGLPSDATPGQYALLGAIVFALGAYFLRGAPALVRFAYPASKGEDEAS